MSESPSILTARQAMIAKRFSTSSSGAQIGGKGSLRRPRKIVTRSTSKESSRKILAVCKKINASDIRGIEEVNFFSDEDAMAVQHFDCPTVKTSQSAHVYIVTGTPTTVNLTSLLPSVANQLSPEMIQVLQQQHAAMGPGAMGPGTMGPGTMGPGGMDMGPGGSGVTIEELDSDDDEVPDLVEGTDFEDFEAASGN